MATGVLGKPDRAGEVLRQKNQTSQEKIESMQQQLKQAEQDKLQAQKELIQRQPITGTPERQVARMKERINAQTETMLKLDKQIEEQVNEVVKLIASIKDSSDTRSRMVKEKGDVIKSLEKSITFYQQKRMPLVEGVRTGNPQVPVESNKAALNFLDTKIETRIDQILKISASLTQNKEWKRYEKYEINFGNDSFGEDGNKTQEYQRHETNIRRAAQGEKSVANSMKKNIEDITAENQRLKLSLAGVSSKEAKADIEAHIKKNEDIIAQRKEKFRSTIKRGQTPAKAVGKRSSAEIRKWIADMTANIKADTNELAHLGAERKNNLMRLQVWQSRLTPENTAQPKPPVVETP